MTASRLRVLVALASFAAVFLVLQINSYTRTSATFDEPVHLAAGYAALARGDDRVDPEHPPFARVWAALPLVALDVRGLDPAAIDRFPPIQWMSTGQLRFSRSWLYRDNDADRLLYAARSMTVLLGLLLGALVFSWAFEWLGFWPAVAALAFYLVEPNLAAHGSLVTTDLPATCFIFGAIYCLWRTCRRASVPNVAALVSCVVLAILTKFSALLLAPVILLLLGVMVFRVGSVRLATAGRVLGLLIAVTWLAVWAAYGFRYLPSASGEWVFRFQDDPVVQQRVPGTLSLVEWIDGHRLLPNALSQGFLLAQAKAQMREGFLAGRYGTEGWWYYFPLAFLIKTPTALIALLVLGIAVIVWRRDRYRPEDAAFVVVPLLVFFGWAMTTRLNIGLRHVLPVYPFVILLGTVATAELAAVTGRGGRTAIGLLAMFWLFEVGRVYPHNLAFFNQLVGGPGSGAAYLVDSNLDWGQDLKGLKRWMDEHGVPAINLAYFGTADPAYYGIDATYLPAGSMFVATPGAVKLPGYVAVSETTLKGVYLSDQARAFYAPLDRLRPVATIGHSIRVYHVERPWW